jgi:hypothetical protein
MAPYGVHQYTSVANHAHASELKCCRFCIICLRKLHRHAENQQPLTNHADASELHDRLADSNPGKGPVADRRPSRGFGILAEPLEANLQAETTHRPLFSCCLVHRPSGGFGMLEARSESTG